MFTPFIPAVYCTWIFFVRVRMCERVVRRPNPKRVLCRRAARFAAIALVQAAHLDTHLYLHRHLVCLVLSTQKTTNSLFGSDDEDSEEAEVSGGWIEPHDCDAFVSIQL